MEQTLQERAQERLQQLQIERQQVAAQLQQLLAQTKQARHMLSAYDGAIGEFEQLLRMANVPASGAIEIE